MTLYAVLDLFLGVWLAYGLPFELLPESWVMDGTRTTWRVEALGFLTGTLWLVGWGLRHG